MPKDPASKELPIPSPEECQTLFINAPIGIFTATPEGRFLSANFTLAKMLGYESPEELIKSVKDIFRQLYADPVDREETKRLVSEKGKLDNHKCPMFRRDGNIILTSRHITKVQDKDGNVIHYQVFVADISKHKQITEDLREESFLRHILVDQFRDGIVVLNEDGSVHEANKRFADMLGYTPEEVQKLHLWDWQPHYSREQLLAMLQKVDTEGDYIETRHKRKDGILQDVEISTNGTVIGGRKLVFCVCRDITDRKQIEERLKQSESRYRSLIESQNDLIVRVDPDNRFTYVNDTYCKVFGKTKEELLGNSFTPLIHEEDRIDTLKAMENLKVPPYRAQMQQRAMTVDGWRWIFWEDSVILDQQGRIVEIQGVGRDITEMKLQQQKLELILKAAQNVSFVMTEPNADQQDALIREFSPGSENLFGYNREEVLGRSVAILHSQEDIEMFPEIHARIAQGQAWHGRARLVRKSGEKFATLFAVYPFDICGWMGTLGVSIDISDLEKAQQELVQARHQAESASQAKSEFLANMSHEIRTPLNGLLGMVDHLLDSGLNEEQEKDAMVLKSSGETLFKLINDILDFSKIEAGKLEISRNEFNLHRVMEDVCRDMAARAGDKALQFHCNLSQDLPCRVCGDDLRLTQILSNLTGNALKFTDQGQVCLNASLKSQTERDCLVYFEVLDTGDGIDTEKIDQLFDKFSQADSSSSRRQGGAGLGLAICRQLATLMGGEIGVESNPGNGSRFWFTVALSHATSRLAGSEQDETASALPREQTYKRGRILLAEDNQVNSMVLGKILDKLGHEAVFAPDGAEAVEVYKNGGVDLVLMDIQMPGIDGLEATRQIRSMEQGTEIRGQRSEVRGQRSEIRDQRSEDRGQKVGERIRESPNSSIPQSPNSSIPQSQNRIPIIALTAHAMKDDMEKSLNAGMDDYITKPVKSRTLQQKIQQWLSLNESKHEKDENQHLNESRNGIAGDVGLETENAKPHFDRKTLLERLDGDKELAVEILKSFLQSVPEQISLVRKEAEAGINSQGQKKAHAIKGTSANIGCMLLSETAARMEQLFKENDMQQLPEQAIILQTKFDQTRQEIESFLREKE